jgi:hypothetical protein
MLVRWYICVVCSTRFDDGLTTEPKPFKLLCDWGERIYIFDWKTMRKNCWKNGTQTRNPQSKPEMSLFNLTCRRRPNMYSDRRSPGSGDKNGPAMSTIGVALLGRITCTSGCSVSPRPPHPLPLVRSWKGVGHTTNNWELWGGQWGDLIRLEHLRILRGQRRWGGNCNFYSFSLTTLYQRTEIYTFSNRWMSTEQWWNDTGKPYRITRRKICTSGPSSK